MVAVEEREGVAVLTLDNPPVNALALPQIDALTAALDSLPNRQPCVLTGDGEAFSAGVDTKAFAAYSKRERAELVLGINAMVAAFYKHLGPLVVALNGHALGGGFVLALCADFRLGMDGADVRLGLTEAKAGIPFPAGPLAVIKHELDPNVCRRLTLTSVTIGVAEARACGVVDELVRADDLLHIALARARTLSDQLAFGEVKQQVRGELAKRLAVIAQSRSDALAKRFLEEKG